MSRLNEAIELTCAIKVKPYALDQQAFANFQRRYHDPRSFIHTGKLLEYFISEQWMQPINDGVYIDIAAQDCPYASYLRSAYGARAYRQDLYYLQYGVHGFDIGGNAAELPFGNEEVRGIALHNSIEHFEGDSDIRFMAEAARVLIPGGVLVIVPLYIAEHLSEEHEAGWIDEHGVKHLWGAGARFARTYGPSEFKERIIESFGRNPDIYRVSPETEESCYFVIFTKK